MRRAACILATAALAATGCGAFGPDMKDRGNDLADCFILKAGVGGPADLEVRATRWLATGAGAGGSVRWGLDGRKLGRWGQAHMGLPFMPLLRNGSRMDVYREPFIRLDPASKALFIAATDVSLERGQAKPPAARSTISILFFDLLAVPALRRKVTWAERDPMRRPINALDLSAGASLLPVSAKIGFSPGQFLDFLLGWTTLDLGRDDAKGDAPKAAERSPRRLQPPPPS